MASVRSYYEKILKLNISYTAGMGETQIFFLQQKLYEISFILIGSCLKNYLKRDDTRSIIPVRLSQIKNHNSIH
jgi:hypothetical protein